LQWIGLHFGRIFLQKRLVTMKLTRPEQSNLRTQSFSFQGCQIFGIACGNLAHFTVVWYIFSHFGMLRKKNLATLSDSGIFTRAAYE
jgi:hypothetical protein